MEPYRVLYNLDKVGLSPSFGSVIPLEDGRLMWVWATGIGKEPYRPVYANYSDDGGRNWGDPVEMKHADGKPLTGVFTTNLLRLPSGSLGLVLCHRLHRIAFFKSDDEGESWSSPVPVHQQDRVYTASDKCLCLSDGRLVVPAYSMIKPKLGDANPKEARLFGQEFSQGERCTLCYSYVLYSDDEGRSWSRSESEVFVPLEKGLKGNFSMAEPSVVELKDGRLLMFGRTNLGRIFRSFSEDRGETWCMPTPTDLVLIPSPCSLKRMPGTGDLLVIWNQTSPWEAMNGFYRHRLSCAISRDEGETWENFKNLISLDDTTRIEPGPIEVVILGPHTQPGDRARYHRSPGPLRCNEPTCTFLKGTAIITHGYCVFGDKDRMQRNFEVEYDELIKRLGLYPHDRGNMVHVIPTEWFYE